MQSKILLQKSHKHKDITDLVQTEKEPHCTYDIPCFMKHFLQLQLQFANPCKKYIKSQTDFLISIHGFEYNPLSSFS